MFRWIKSALMGPGIGELAPKGHSSNEINSYDFRLIAMPKFEGSFTWPKDKQPPWIVEIRVWTTDIARLMREGIAITSANLCRERGAVTRHNGEVPILLEYEACQMIRTFYLADQKRRPLWEARLIVSGPKFENIAQFRLTDLTPDRVMFAWASNKKRQEVYRWDYQHPASAYNAIYDDMPLGPWWPWPNNGSSGLQQEKPQRSGVLETPPPYRDHDGMETRPNTSTPLWPLSCASARN